MTMETPLIQQDETPVAPPSERSASFDNYLSTNQAVMKIVLLRNVAYAVFALPFLVLLSTLIYSIFYVPTPRDILFNHFGALYRQEDLTKSTQNEGEVKQIAKNWVTHVFSYNHVSFVDNATYQEYLTGKKSVSLPDHRDEIRPYFTDAIYNDVVKKLEESPWMADFRTQRRGNSVSFYAPPIQDNEEAELRLNEANKLTVSYKGYLYITSQGYRVPERLYRVDFEVVMERKPNNVSPEYPSYFFSPMVQDNYTEWRFSEFKWTTKRER